MARALRLMTHGQGSKTHGQGSKTHGQGYRASWHGSRASWHGSRASWHGRMSHGRCPSCVMADVRHASWPMCVMVNVAECGRMWSNVEPDSQMSLTWTNPHTNITFMGHGSQGHYGHGRNTLKDPSRRRYLADGSRSRFKSAEYLLKGSITGQ